MHYAGLPFKKDVRTFAVCMSVCTFQRTITSTLRRKPPVQKYSISPPLMTCIIWIVLFYQKNAGYTEGQCPYEV